MNLGNAIKQVRTQKKINQLDLANQAGISQAALSKIENDIKAPGKKTLKLICEALDISEGLLHILSIEKADVPKGNEPIYQALFPEIKNMIFQIIETEKPDNNK